MFLAIATRIFTTVVSVVYSAMTSRILGNVIVLSVGSQDDGGCSWTQSLPRRTPRIPPTPESAPGSDRQLLDKTSTVLKYRVSLYVTRRDRLAADSIVSTVGAPRAVCGRSAISPSQSKVFREESARAAPRPSVRLLLVAFDEADAASEPRRTTVDRRPDARTPWNIIRLKKNVIFLSKLPCRRPACVFF